MRITDSLRDLGAIVRGNVFMSGKHASAAVTFAPGGDTLVVTGNVFAGPTRELRVAEGFSNVAVRENAQ